MQKNGVFSLIWSFPHKSIVEIKKMSYSANESVLTNIYYKQQTKELNMTEIEKLKKEIEDLKLIIESKNNQVESKNKHIKRLEKIISNLKNKSKGGGVAPD